MKKGCLFVFVLMLFVVTLGSQGVVEAADAQIVDLSKGASYSSHDYYAKAQKLVETYPNLLHLEVIGQSRDSKPIYAIVMTDNVKEAIKRDDFNVFRQHYYVEAGNHAREIVNTAIVLKQIEDYCKDYYNDNHVSKFNLKNELSQSVIHFIPLVNPDGHDLVKFGRSSVKTEEGLKLLDNVKDKNYKRFKANIAGVDLNRNFPDEYYDINNKQWVDKFQKHINQFHSYVPHGEFYSGPYGGSEPETQAVMKYVTKYDFRNFLSYHSMGKVVYCGKYWFSKDYNDRALSLAKVVNNVNGYTILPDSNGKGSGYFTDHAVAQTLKPIVTVETTGVQTPTPQSQFNSAYKENYLLPLYFIQEGKKTGYFKYRLYVDNKYVRDFNEKVYAQAHADRVEGAKIVEGKGVPEAYLIETINRGDCLTEIIGKYYDLTSLTIDATDTFTDTQSVIPTFAKNNGIVSGTQNYFRSNDNITPLEVAVLLYNVHKNIGFEEIAKQDYLNYELVKEYPTWAEDAIKYCLYNGLIPEKVFDYPYFDAKHISLIENNVVSEAQVEPR